MVDLDRNRNQEDNNSQEKVLTKNFEIIDNCDKKEMIIEKISTTVKDIDYQKTKELLYNNNKMSPAPGDPKTGNHFSNLVLEIIAQYKVKKLTKKLDSLNLELEKINDKDTIFKLKL